MMKKIILLLGWFSSLIISGGCDRQANNVLAPSKPIHVTERSLTLQAFGKYNPVPGLASLFLWPDEEDSKIIAVNLNQSSLDMKSIAANVGEYSTRFDKLYNQLAPEKKKYNQLSDHKIELWDKYKEENFPKMRKKRLNELMHEQGCEDRPGGDETCPQDCQELADPPWSKPEEVVNNCRKEMDAVFGELELSFDKENKQLIDEMNKLDSKIASYTEKITSYSEMVINSVEPYPNNPTKMKNWLEIDYSASAFEHQDGETPPKITLNLKINNSNNNELNHHLLYRSSVTEGKAEISDVKVYLEKGAPTLKFIIHEKRLDFDGEGNEMAETFTGNIYEVVLRRGLQDFGLLYLGKVRYLNSNGISLRDGMMKILLEED